jgi:L-ascorbate metabolism protein UlaG (beta-lactamase superfamily)
VQVTLLSHASLWIEHGGVRVLVDPWLTGTCYGGAWALCPEVLDTVPRPDWVLYSHRHPDHLHLPTLRALAARFGADLRLALARDALGRTAASLRALGFPSVHELPLGRDCPLGGDLSVSLHAVRADDTT